MNESRDKNIEAKKMSPIKVFLVLVPIAFLGLSSGKTIRLNRTIVRNNKFETRIIDGQKASGGQFAYSAHLLSTVPGKLPSGAILHYDLNCDGSVISQQHILTAAHCVDGSFWVRVTLGFYDDTVVGGERLYAGKNIHVHDGFNSTTLENDIAVVEVYNPIAFSSVIKAVQLSCIYTQPNTQVQVAGSGLTSDAAIQFPPDLQYVNLFTISNQECSTELPHIFPSKICARGTNEQGTCHGDSGAAMVEMVNGVQVQVALVSSSSVHRSCERGLPDSYTRISCFTDWIETLAPITCFRS